MGAGHTGMRIKKPWQAFNLPRPQFLPVLFPLPAKESQCARYEGEANAGQCQ